METKNIIKNIFKQPNLWGSVVPMNIFGIYALYSIFLGSAPAWWWIATITGYVCIAMLGIAIGYHRLFCHSGFKVNKLVKRILLFFGVLAGQDSPIWWISVHRGSHHRYADTPKDAHSPKDGFWHSYILWIFKTRTIKARAVIDLLRDPDMIFVHRHYLKILWGTNIILAVISIDLWLYLLAFPTFITLHCFLTQTSVTHLQWAGYRNYNVNDDSVNVPWLFPFALGEVWHNNHHGDGRNPNYGGRRWWELDPSFWIIQAIRTDK
jgi:stearoyl-CoA desaturase (delta-9 desaturase)